MTDPPLGPEDQLVLVDLVNRVLDRGVVIAGEVTISVGGIDLVQLGLNLYVASTETAIEMGMPRPTMARALPSAAPPVALAADPDSVEEP